MDKDASIVERVNSFLEGFLNKSSAQYLSSKNVSFEDLHCDFIPYACYYSDDTVLTKSGELMQVVKIVDLCSADVVNSRGQGVRDIIRSFIKENIADHSFFVYIHTIRKKKGIELEYVEQGDYSDDLEKMYKDLYTTDNEYFNELYITIVSSNKGESAIKESFLNSLYPKRIVDICRRNLKTSYEMLDGVVSKLCSELSFFKPKKLSVKSSKKSLIAEHCSFFNYLINGVNVRKDLVNIDLSSHLSVGKIAYGFNTAEVKSLKSSKSKYFAILGIKDHGDLSIHNINRILNLPCNFIISQSCSFVSGREIDNDHFKKYNYQLEFSGAKDLINDMYIKEMGSNSSDQMFSHHSISMTIIEDSADKLEEAVSNAFQAFSDIGLIVYRCDVRLEQKFWSRLPGNFSFIDTKYPTLVEYLGSFASLHNFSCGRMLYNKWGSAVNMLRSIDDNYYFFNFHDGDAGHTSVVGSRGSGKTAVVNFLVSSSRKYGIKMFYIDFEGQSELFLKSINKKYVDLNSDLFNLCRIEDTEQNRNFVAEMLVRMRGLSNNKEKNEKIFNVARKISKYIFEEMPEGRRYLSEIQNILSKLGGNTDKWYGDGKFANIFDADTTEIWDGDICGVDCARMIEDYELSGPVLRYILYNFEMKLDGSPTILVIEESWILSSVFETEESLKQWMDRMEKLNVVIVFILDVSNLEASKLFISCINREVATHIVFPLQYFSEENRKYLNLSEEDFKQVHSMVGHGRHIMVKQSGESVILKLDLEDAKEAQVLSADKYKISVMEKAMKKASSRDASKWLSLFYKILEKDKKSVGKKKNDLKDEELMEEGSEISSEFEIDDESKVSDEAEVNDEVVE